MRKSNVERAELEVPEVKGVEVVKYSTPPEPEIKFIEGEVEKVADELIKVLEELL